MDPTTLTGVDPEFAKFATYVVGALLTLISTILGLVGVNFLKYTRLIRADLARFNTQAIEHLAQVSKLAELLMAEDPHAKVPSTPYIVSLIDKFNDAVDEVGYVHTKVDRILERLDIPVAALARRRSTND